jgi:hypothetical protein
MNRVDKRHSYPFYSTNHLSRPTAAQLIEEAKASLSKPSRPFTPHPGGKILKTTKTEETKELPTNLQPLDPVGPVKVTKRRVRVKSLQRKDITLGNTSLINPMLRTLEFIPFWHEYLHYIEPFERVDLSLVRINLNDSEESVNTKLKQQKYMVSKAMEILENSNDSRRIQELATVVIEFGTNEIPFEKLFEKLYEISCDDIQKPLKTLTDQLLDYLEKKTTNYMDQLYIFSIFRNMSDSILAHDELIEFDVLRRIGQFFAQKTISDKVEESKLFEQIIGFIYNIIASNDYFTLLDSKVVGKLCELVDYNSAHYTDYTLMLLCFKTLAVCSENVAFIDILCNSSFITSLFDRIIECSQNPFEHVSFLLRIFYILGNLTSSQHLSSEFATETLDDVIALFGILLDNKNIDSEKMNDLFLKIIRYIANVALIPQSGIVLKGMVEITDLFQFLDSDDEELQLNTISCLANISYYASPCDLLFTEYLNQFQSYFT